MKRDELIPGYLAAQAATTAAHLRYRECEDLRNDLRDQLVTASREEAANQIGAVVEMFGQPHKITRLCPHYLNASVMYPVVVRRLSNGKAWGSKEMHAYSWAFNFELRLWEHGTVSADDGFKPSGNHPAVVPEIQESTGA